MVRTTSGEFVAVDVNDLSDAITREMSSLKDELSSLRSEREHELRSVKRMMYYVSRHQHFLCRNSLLRPYSYFHSPINISIRTYSPTSKPFPMTTSPSWRLTSVLRYDKPILSNFPSRLDLCKTITSTPDPCDDRDANRITPRKTWHRVSWLFCRWCLDLYVDDISN